MPFPTYLGTIRGYCREYDQHLLSHRTSSFIFPIEILNYVLLIACLVLWRRPPLPIRILVFLSIFVLSCLSLQTSRTLGLAYGLLIGISNSWCILLSANLLFLFEPAKDFKRQVTSADTAKHDRNSVDEGKSERHWEAMPESTLNGLFWVLDLLGSLRALHWSYGYFSEPACASTRGRDLHNTTSLHRNICKLLLIYFGLDCLKEIIAMDPYFWGYTDHEGPRYIGYVTASPDLVQAFRMSVAFAVLYLAIELVSTAGFCVCVNILGPPFAGPWGHEWAYLPQFGNFNSICVKGLRGWWGAWWHQLFRNMLTAPAKTIVNALPVPSDSAAAKGIRIIVPFLISGVIHACGSYTIWGATKPMNSCLFFVLQPVGIAVQEAGSWALNRLDRRMAIPRRFRQATNVLFTAVWLLKTFPLLADDFERGGLWLTEPFPISVVQMLGLGSKARSHRLWSACTIDSHL